ncbi:MAG TPA: CopL family metal-binding regulatory protein [Lysobacter sp.]|nr:CopL family metal-binding regulatory protein [Lysobacter sp.]
MLIWPILLRILLTAGLILNGSGYAAASVHAHAGAVDSAAPAAACHGHEVDTAAPDHSAVVSAIAHAALADGSAPPPSDGCETDDCGSACAQHSAAAVITAVHRRDAVIARERGNRVMASGRAPPALPNPIRPPIG